MNDLREKLAKAIWDEIRELEDRCDMEWDDMPDPYTHFVAADAIIAALPDMVDPMVWDDHPFNGEPVLSMAKVNGGAYFICDDTDDFSGNYLQFISCDDVRWWQNVRSTCLTIKDRVHDDDIAPLKAAAQAHHAAKIMQALGVET